MANTATGAQNQSSSYPCVPFTCGPPCSISLFESTEPGSCEQHACNRALLYHLLLPSYEHGLQLRIAVSARPFVASSALTLEYNNFEQPPDVECLFLISRRSKPGHFLLRQCPRFPTREHGQLLRRLATDSSQRGRPGAATLLPGSVV